MNNLAVVSIGGFGHIDAVLSDIASMQQVRFVGLSAAYDGEDISNFLNLKQARGVKTYTEYKLMLDELKPDVAIIGTRLDLIGKTIIDAANAGCHIICEKPLALDLKTFEEVQKAVENNRRNLMAMLTMRSEPYFIAAKKVYDSGDIGEAVLINARKSYKWGSRPEWFGHKDKYGGTIGWVGIHAFDCINFVTGLGFNRIAVLQGNFSHIDRPACEDNCVIILELSNGGHASVSIDYFRPENAQNHGDDWIRIAGTEGVLEASGPKNDCVVISKNKGNYQQPTSVMKDGIYSRFLMNILEGESNSEIQDASFMLTRLCLLAREAAERGEVLKPA